MRRMVCVLNAFLCTLALFNDSCVCVCVQMSKLCRCTAPGRGSHVYRLSCVPGQKKDRHDSPDMTVGGTIFSPLCYMYCSHPSSTSVCVCVFFSLLLLFVGFACLPWFYVWDFFLRSMSVSFQHSGFLLFQCIFYDCVFWYFCSCQCTIIINTITFPASEMMKPFVQIMISCF